MLFIRKIRSAWSLFLVLLVRKFSNVFILIKKQIQIPISIIFVINIIFISLDDLTPIDTDNQLQIIEENITVLNIDISRSLSSEIRFLQNDAILNNEKTIESVEFLNRQHEIQNKDIFGALNSTSVDVVVLVQVFFSNLYE